MISFQAFMDRCNLTDLMVIGEEAIPAARDRWFDGVQVKILDVTLHYESAEIQDDDLLNKINRGELQYYNDFVTRNQHNLAAGVLNDTIRTLIVSVVIVTTKVFLHIFFFTIASWNQSGLSHISIRGSNHLQRYG